MNQELWIRNQPCTFDEAFDWYIDGLIERKEWPAFIRVHLSGNRDIDRYRLENLAQQYGFGGNVRFHALMLLY